MDYLKNVFKVILCIVITLYLSACSMRISQYDDSRIKLITTRMDKQSKILSRLCINDYLLGYDSSGKVSMWVNCYEGLTSQETDQYKLTSIADSYMAYHSYIGKYLFDHFPNVDQIWLYSEDDIENACTYLTRKNYEGSKQSRIKFNKDDFFKIRNIKQMVNYSRYGEKTGDFPKDDLTNHYFIQDAFESLFGSRLMHYDISDISDDAFYIEAKIKGFPTTNGDSDALNQEISKAFSYSVGRFAVHYWNSVSDCILNYYDNNGNKLFTTVMYNDEFKAWSKDGLDYHKWYRYCREIRKYNNKVNFDEKTVNRAQKPKPISSSSSYDEVMEKLKNMNHVKVLMLGKGRQGLDAVLRLDGLTTINLYQREMEVSKQLMKMKLHSVWFFSGEGKKTKMIYMDQERYKVLMYLNPAETYDFTPAQWPLMAGKYWEVQEVM